MIILATSQCHMCCKFCITFASCSLQRVSVTILLWFLQLEHLLCPPCTTSFFSGLVGARWEVDPSWVLRAQSTPGQSQAQCPALVQLAFPDLPVSRPATHSCMSSLPFWKHLQPIVKNFWTYVSVGTQGNTGSICRAYWLKHAPGGFNVPSTPMPRQSRV